MFTQLPEEKRDLIKPLFQKKQPNNSALWCYLDGKMTGKTFVDDITSPTKAIWACDEENAELIRDGCARVWSHAEGGHRNKTN